jgi:hypothetical protein
MSKKGFLRLKPTFSSENKGKVGGVISPLP